MKRLTLWTLILALLVLLAAPALAEDEKKYVLPLDLSPGMPLIQDNYSDKWNYKDPTIEMTVREVRDEKNRYWIAEVTIADATQLRTMPAHNYTSSGHMDGKRLSRRANAVLACDGDYWWKDVKWKGNYVLRQGKLYMRHLHGHTDVLLIDEDGNFNVIKKAQEKDVPLPDEETGIVMYNGKQIYNGLCFGPALVLDGEAQTIEQNNKMMSEKKPARMALCQLGKLKYALVCAYANTVTLQEFACLLEYIGVETAYNLDGGNSAMMFTGGKMINQNNTTREIGDIIYFASAWSGEETPDASAQ